MNIEEYIATGILELYVLGELSTEEAADVEAMAVKHPRIREELNAIEDSLEGFAKSFSKTPPPSVKEKLFAKIESEVSQTTLQEEKIIPLKDVDKPAQKFSILPYLVAASVTLAVLFAGTTLYYYSKWKSTKTELIALQQENVEIANNYNKAKLDLRNHENFLAAVRDPDSKRIELKGLPNSPDSKVVVFWNSRTNIVFLDPLSLPEPPTDKQYQLWALLGDKPIDAGVLASTDSGSLQKMKDIGAAEAFAITLEKKGGSPSPTLSALYVMGKI